MKANKAKRSKVSSIPELPEELQLEILSRMPSKTLMKCKCVSNEWYHSLTFRAFLLCHSRAHAHPTLYLFVKLSMEKMLKKEWWNTMQLLSFPHNDNGRNRYNSLATGVVKGHHVRLPNYAQKYSEVSNFCNGLVCLFNPWSFSNNLPICLFSVRTQDIFPFRAVSEITVSFRKRNKTSLYITDSWCFLGFDCTRKEYRVLRILKLEKNATLWGQCRSSIFVCHCRYEILTLGPHQFWKSLDPDNIPPSIREGCPNGKKGNSFCLDGVVYWMHCNSVRFWNQDIIVASFELNNERFRTFKVDELIGSSYKPNSICACYLTSIKGCPTLLVCMRRASYETLILTLENHTHTNAVWTTTRIFTHELSVGSHYPICSYVGGIIIKDTMVDNRYIDSRSLYYQFIDLENGSGAAWIMEVHPKLEFEGPQVLRMDCDIQT